MTWQSSLASLSVPVALVVVIGSSFLLGTMLLFRVRVAPAVVGLLMTLPLVLAARLSLATVVHVALDTAYTVPTAAHLPRFSESMAAGVQYWWTACLAAPAALPFLACCAIAAGRWKGATRALGLLPLGVGLVSALFALPAWLVFDALPLTWNAVPFCIALAACFLAAGWTFRQAGPDADAPTRSADAVGVRPAVSGAPRLSCARSPRTRVHGSQRPTSILPREPLCARQLPLLAHIAAVMVLQQRGADAHRTGLLLDPPRCDVVHGVEQHHSLDTALHQQVVLRANHRLGHVAAAPEGFAEPEATVAVVHVAEAMLDHADDLSRPVLRDDSPCKDFTALHRGHDLVTQEDQGPVVGVRPRDALGQPPYDVHIVEVLLHSGSIVDGEWTKPEPRGLESRDHGTSPSRPPGRLVAGLYRQPERLALNPANDVAGCDPHGFPDRRGASRQGPQPSRISHSIATRRRGR